MTLPDPTDVIAPRGDDLPYETHEFISQMIEVAYPDGVVLEYHGLKLYSHTNYENGIRVDDVYTADQNYVETVNLNAFRTITEVKQFLDEIVAYDPTDRGEWVSSR
ncbi:MAG: hypothetical protein A07HR60_00959 [uncultured archaeon A07HR60]|jgi:hypothetical protein|nr:MAG: hypothetical protein J07HR59_00372 [Halorubrum sp. J07HR59]ESS12021.1 MAG: hypothetical protein A07HR60_00959 [uncultured archaeon A07HR60]